MNLLEEFNALQYSEASAFIKHHVAKAQCFDEHLVVLRTDCGEMTVEGEALHVGALDIDKGEIEITGRISAVCYTDAAAPKRGLRARFFG